MCVQDNYWKCPPFKQQTLSPFRVQRDSTSEGPKGTERLGPAFNTYILMEIPERILEKLLTLVTSVQEAGLADDRPPGAFCFLNCAKFLPSACIIFVIKNVKESQQTNTLQTSCRRPTAHSSELYEAIFPAGVNLLSPLLALVSWLRGGILGLPVAQGAERIKQDVQHYQHYVNCKVCCKPKSLQSYRGHQAL